MSQTTVTPASSPLSPRTENRCSRTLAFSLDSSSSRSDPSPKTTHPSLNRQLSPAFLLSNLHSSTRQARRGLKDKRPSLSLTPVSRTRSGSTQRVDLATRGWEAQRERERKEGRRTRVGGKARDPRPRETVLELALRARPAIVRQSKARSVRNSRL
jgi:hypothetical protein